jgi:hypothetical protein
VALSLASVALLSGCLGKPKIEDRWTRVDVRRSNVTPGQLMPAGMDSISVRAAITYRAIVTGFAVAELRQSTVASPAAVVNPDADRVRMAQEIDQILANSVTRGRATRAVTGWDHLIQEIEFAFNGNVPAGMDSTGNPPNLFVLCYLGSGDRVERQDGSDTLIVTPFNSSQFEILPVGMKVGVAP